MPRQSNRKMEFESLEDRRLLAGSVVVSLSSADPRDLQITGDHESNQILVEEVGTDLIRVRGLNGTTIKSSNPFAFTFPNNSMTFRVTDDVRIDLGDGDDQATVRHLNLTNAYHNDLSVEMGSGNDVLNLFDIEVERHLTVNGGDGRDDIEIAETTFDGNLTVNGQSGNDNIEIREVNAETTGNFTLDGGTGHDEIVVDESGTAGSILLKGDVGDDGLVVKNSTGLKVTLDGDAGDDRLRLFDSNAFDVNIYGNSGNDSLLSIRNSTLNYRVFLGSGDDTAYHYQVDAFDSHYLNGGSGNDSLTGQWWWGGVSQFE